MDSAELTGVYVSTPSKPTTILLVCNSDLIFIIPAGRGGHHPSKIEWLLRVMAPIWSGPLCSVSRLESVREDRCLVGFGRWRIPMDPQRHSSDRFRRGDEAIPLAKPVHDLSIVAARANHHPTGGRIRQVAFDPPRELVPYGGSLPQRIVIQNAACGDRSCARVPRSHLLNCPVVPVIASHYANVGMAPIPKLSRPQSSTTVQLCTWHP
jgi:hypothetical protein